MGPSGIKELPTRAGDPAEVGLGVLFVLFLCNWFLINPILKVVMVMTAPFFWWLAGK